jgi:hypothetical protein
MRLCPLAEDVTRTMARSVSAMRQRVGVFCSYCAAVYGAQPAVYVLVLFKLALASSDEHGRYQIKSGHHLLTYRR